MLRGGDWEVELAERVLLQLYELLESQYPLYASDVSHAITVLSSDPSVNLKQIFEEKVYVPSQKKSLPPKQSIKKNTSTASRNMISCLESDRPVRERRIWPWPWQWRH